MALFKNSSNGSKLVAVHIIGPETALDYLLLSASGYLSFISPSENPAAFTQQGESRCEALVSRMEKLSKNLGIKATPAAISDSFSKEDEIVEYITRFSDKYNELQGEKSALEREISSTKDSIGYLENIKGLNVTFERLFSAKYLKIRFGRIPVDSGNKIIYYSDHLFFFFPFYSDQSYIWGMYITTNALRNEVDDIFRALFFERLRIPEALRGTPQDARSLLRDELNELIAKQKDLSFRFESFMGENLGRFSRLYGEAVTLALRERATRHVSIVAGRFYMSVFAPREQLNALKKSIADIPGVSLEIV